MDSEKQMIEKVLNGNLSAFEMLVQDYYGMFAGFYVKHGVSRHDAQDLAQDTLVKAYEKLAFYDGRWAFSTWIYSIASNIYKDFLKKNRHAALNLEDAQHLRDPAPDNLERLIASQTARQLLKALKPDVRSMLVLHYHSGLIKRAATG